MTDAEQADRDRINRECETLILAAVDHRSSEAASEAGAYAGRVARLALADKPLDVAMPAFLSFAGNLATMLGERAKAKGVPESAVQPLWTAFWRSFSDVTGAVAVTPGGNA